MKSNPRSNVDADQLKSWGRAIELQIKSLAKAQRFTVIHGEGWNILEFTMNQLKTLADEIKKEYLRSY